MTGATNFTKGASSSIVTLIILNDEFPIFSCELSSMHDTSHEYVPFERFWLIVFVLPSAIAVELVAFKVPLMNTEQFLIPLPKSLTLYWKLMFPSVSRELLDGASKLTIGGVISAPTVKFLPEAKPVFGIKAVSVQFTVQL